MNTNRSIEVSEYRLATRTGQHIRLATMVTVDGKRVRFLERMSKREAVRNALSLIERHPERYV